MNGPVIQKMTDELASQIAAGEVVDRPSSVVKELIENSIDAGAKTISVETVDGGLSLIMVRDDGVGMEKEDVVMSVMPHATSKLGSIDDLLTLKTLGFRGEALSSIASVSRLLITSKKSEHLTGVLVDFEVGVAKSIKAFGGAVGTRVEVKDLFYNVPARKKFLKRPEVETSHIYESIIRLALCHPTVAFVYTAEGKKWLELPSSQSLIQRAEAIFCKKEKDPSHRLYGLQAKHEHWYGDICLSPPGWNFSTARNIYLLINGRFIKDRSIQHAVIAAFGEILPQGRYPLFIGSWSIPSHEVDVNVHPQKLEVRFLEPNKIYSFVQSMVKQLVIKAPWLTYSLEEQNRSQNSALIQSSPHRPWNEKNILPENSYRNKLDSLENNGAYLSSGLFSSTSVLKEQVPLYPAGTFWGDNLSTDDFIQKENKIARGFFIKLRYIGQWHKTYLLCEAPKELILIDQHAAHESLAFQRLKLLYQDAVFHKQQLLFPVQRDILPAEHSLLQENLLLLEKLGFDIRLYGANTAVLSAVPDAKIFGRGAKCYLDPVVLLDKVITDLSKDKKHTAVAERVDHLLATIACHSVVRAGDVLEFTAAQELLNQLDEVPIEPYCPHGRPVLVRMSSLDIERRFGRT